MELNNKLLIKMNATVIDCREPRKLADFYAVLMNWVVHYTSDDYIMMGPPEAFQAMYPQLAFQFNPDYEPPIWPEEPGAQQQMMHIDFAVNDVEKAVEHAISCGAKVAATQFSDSHTVMLDPEGHPFCLCPMKKSVFDNPNFALL